MGFFEVFAALLSGFFAVIPSYGLAIILLTLTVRIVLLPLSIKQTRSQREMQRIMPEVKALQKKHKGDRQKINEETMKLYKEHGVNPLAGCLPLLAQFPVLIALFLVIQFPNGLTHTPRDSDLETAIKEQQTSFAGMNMLCNALQAGTEVDIPDEQIPDTRSQVTPRQLDCGQGIPVRIPYYVLAAAMIGTTFYQQRQMQRASPPGAAQQQQALMRIMPLIFGFWGFFFPAGLVLYWTTTNLVQIGQQHFLVVQKKRAELVSAGPKASAAGDGLVKEDGRAKRSDKPSGQPDRAPGREPSGRRTVPGSGTARAGKGQRGQSGRTQGSKGGPGGRSGGDRKKRRKR